MTAEDTEYAENRLCFVWVLPADVVSAISATFAVNVPSLGG
jgi:hypothetical protein